MSIKKCCFNKMNLGSKILFIIYAVLFCASFFSSGYLLKLFCDSKKSNKLEGSYIYYAIIIVTSFITAVTPFVLYKVNVKKNESNDTKERTINTMKALELFSNVVADDNYVKTESIVDDLVNKCGMEILLKNKVFDVEAISIIALKIPYSTIEAVINETIINEDAVDTDADGNRNISSNFCINLCSIIGKFECIGNYYTSNLIIDGIFENQIYISILKFSLIIALLESYNVFSDFMESSFDKVTPLKGVFEKYVQVRRISICQE